MIVKRKKNILMLAILSAIMLITSSFSMNPNIVIAAELASTKSPEVTKPAELFLQLTDPKERLFFNALARPDGEDMVYHIKGKAYAYVPGDLFKPALKHGTPLFGIEGYNIRKAVQVKGTNDLMVLTREIVFYTDLKTGKILKKWTNPLTGKTYPIAHIENDQVNFHYRVADGKLKAVVEAGGREIGAFPIEAPEQIGDTYTFHADAFPLYNLEERYNISDSMNLKNDIYASAEFFDFMVPNKYLKKMKGKKVPKGTLPIVNTWSRVSPWTPWMGLDENEYAGNLTFHARGEVMDGFDDLPDWIRKEVEENYPLYKSSLKTIDSKPNTTSWTSFYTNVLKPVGKTWREWAGLE
ncbi:DUF1838 family protein [Sporosarcina sp. E16_3]|uniref:DUF1838 family protein n=1 Tax=Sporosarcina sp. E16_3 TaxID=2789293 RepID=UPI001A9144F7|nr:DUF1838 family protein [Sporosarcina sp. E16_3]MBO0603003.1 DUF1838 family protein [Sporosarcina sp. E16_3]